MKNGHEERTTIPDNQTSVSSFSLVRRKVKEQLRSLVEKPIREEEAEPFKLVKRVYQFCLNTSNLIDKLLRFISCFLTK